MQFRANNELDSLELNNFSHDLRAQITRTEIFYRLFRLWAEYLFIHFIQAWN